MVRLSVIGLGKLGACTAASFASRGFYVTGVDINKSFVDAVNKGRAPVCEPALQETISACQDRLTATTDYARAIADSDVTFLIVPTPSMENGHFSHRYLCDALKHLALALKGSDKRTHLFAITSTVSPGTTEKHLIPLIASTSGRRLNGGFEVCYNPEFIALGSVIKDFLNPDVVLIGQSSPEAGSLLASIYEKACQNKPHIAQMSIVSAEITKISLNSYVTMKISFANTLANICETTAGADVDDITRAIGADRRVSPYYLKGGLGFGGPCFPRDNRAFAAFAAEHGIDATLAKATDAVNSLQTRHLVEHVMNECERVKDPVVGILGLAYKPNTPVIEESAAIALVEELLNREMRVVVYDPCAMNMTRDRLGSRVGYASSVRDCMARADVCVVMTPTSEFKLIDHTYIGRPTAIIIDCWRIVDPAKLGTRATYVPVGVCRQEKGVHATKPAVQGVAKAIPASGRERPTIVEKT